ncbi:hypothetical protein RF11_05850 [Thelohanellus kitauei]|uniref:Uncharacterized protein n=1 Tax=Thelohanellus kitauei TaxID=669202 RepID=A0A0C2M266_THEKT|nr:hypothetical protein RF11_05850 [Thelohanellus kitauei]
MFISPQYMYMTIVVKYFDRHNLTYITKETISYQLERVNVKCTKSIRISYGHEENKILVNNILMYRNSLFISVYMKDNLLFPNFGFFMNKAPDIYFNIILIDIFDVVNIPILLSYNPTNVRTFYYRLHRFLSRNSMPDR